MKDNTSLYKTPKAIGKVCVELKNPETGEVVKKVEGHNHIWTDNLFTTDWYTWLQHSTLCLTNYTDELDTSLPFIPGNLIGYGYYGCTGSGNLRGVYNSTNSFIRKQSETGKTSKFSYDFTTNQANGTINYIGFSEQFEKIVNYQTSASDDRYNRYKFSPKKIYGNNNSNGHMQPYIVQDPNDVKYIYIPIISSYSDIVGANSFVVAKMNLLSGEIDNLFYPPKKYNNTSHNQRIIIDNNNYYWLCDNKLYKYSNSNFETLEKEYTIPFIDEMDSNSPSAKRTTIIDDILYTYQPIEQNSSTAKWFSVDLNAEELELNPFTLEATFEDSGYFNTPTFSNNAYAIGHIVDIPNSKYKTVSFTDETYTYKACIIDFSNKKIIGFLNPNYYLSYYGSNSQIPFFRLPINSDQGIWKTKDYFISNDSTISTESFYNVGAISAFKLPKPITKTNEYAMTVTYEIEVKWSDDEGE